MKKQFWAIMYLAFCMAAVALGQRETGSGERVLRFGKGPALGMLRIADANITCDMQQFHHWVAPHNWEHFFSARGDVTIPAGKCVLLLIFDAHRKDLTSLGQLPPDALHSLRLSGNYQNYGVVGAREVEAICKLSGLKELTFSNVTVPVAALEHLKELTSLEMLTTPADMTQAGFRHVCRLKQLKSLYLDSDRLIDKALEHLEDLSELEQLTLGGKMLSDDCLHFVTRLPKLAHLALLGGFSDQCTVYLKDMPSLKVFYPYKLDKFTDAALPNIAKCTQLEKLGLYDAPVTDAGLVHLTKVTNLRALNIDAYGQRQVPITDAGMAHVGKITSLEHLSIDSGVTDRGIGYLSNLKKLRYFWGPTNSNSPLTDKTLEHIGKLRALQELHISGTGFTDRGMDYLAGLIDLRKLSLSPAAGNVTSEGIGKLAALKDLEELKFAGSKVTIVGLSRLGGMAHLKALDVSGIGQDNSVLDISGLSKLETLRLSMKTRRTGEIRSYDPLRDEDLKCLAKLKNIRILHVSAGDAITDEGFAHLAGLTNLEELSIGGAGITDEGLRHLSGMKRLYTLRLNRADITGAGLKYLYGLDSLRTVYIRCEDACSRPAIELLRKKMPGLQTVDISPVDNRTKELSL